MYLLTPILFVLASLCGISVIVWRKAPYIKKLASADSSSSESIFLSNKDFLSRLFYDLFPELVETLKAIKFHEYKESWLLETEKFLRRLRLLSLRMDRLSNTLIHKVRRGYLGIEKPSVAKDESRLLETISTPPVIVKTEEKSDEETWKKEEQRLIIDIAKNPKDSRLYDNLSDLYTKMGDFSDAKESLEAAIELDPNNEELKKKHSHVLEKLGSQNF